jgi:hypothetical protein
VVDQINLARVSLGSDPRVSWEIAENIYFDQDSLPVLFFPIDHFAAVYIPLLFPPLFAVVTGWFAYIKLIRQKRKEAGEKKQK